MIEIVGDLWTTRLGPIPDWRIITTNGCIKNNGEAVMGRGVALQATSRYPDLPQRLGQAIKTNGNVPALFRDYRLLTWPVKYNFWEPADLGLIEASTHRIVAITSELRTEYRVRLFFLLVRPGCGNGGLRWEDVCPIIAPLLDDHFVVVQQL